MTNGLTIGLKMLILYLNASGNHSHEVPPFEMWKTLKVCESANMMDYMKHVCTALIPAAGFNLGDRCGTGNTLLSKSEHEKIGHPSLGATFSSAIYLVSGT